MGHSKNKQSKSGRGIAFKVISIAVAIIVTFSAAMVLVLRWLPIPTSSFMLQSSFKGASVAYRWVDWQYISPALAIAVVAAEDQKFPMHAGFDLEAIAQAVNDNKTRSRPRGASTISQQVAKNLFLWPGRSWTRKGLEVYFTFLIESLWSKQRILEVYLNIAQFGPTIFGAGEASRAYFGIPAAKLTPKQAAAMAAVLPNPSQLDINHPSAYLRHRTAEIQQQVKLLGGPRYLSTIVN